MTAIKTSKKHSIESHYSEQLMGFFIFRNDHLEIFSTVKVYELFF
jgi:hypothetical protein